MEREKREKACSFILWFTHPMLATTRAYLGLTYGWQESQYLGHCLLAPSKQVRWIRSGVASTQTITPVWYVGI